MAILTTKYEVFLSFRGSDTRQGFTDVLYNHLKEIGIQVFRDDDELASGDKIESILDALKNSTICVPIFSKSFASSAWCLREVAKMVELNKVIIPIFYDVTVEDVKLKTPLFVDLLKDQHQKYGREKALVEEWEKALVEVTKVKGRKLNDDTGFYVFSKQFTAEILLKLGGKQQFTTYQFVEMTDQTETAMHLLDIQYVDVLYLGLYGMGGIGKTTLAKKIFNRISSSYDACSFLANIRQEFNTKGLGYLQKKLQQDLNPKASIRYGACWMKSSLQMKSVLIVLDDVSEISHIRELIEEPSSFGAGSRIIITTRDERVVSNFMPTSSSSDESSTKVSPRIARMEIEGMKPKQAMQLFCGHAFGSSSPPPEYLSLSHEVISISAGLPLALEVIGSLLCGASIQSWIAKISKLKEIPAGRVQEKLMISYEALEEDEKEIFLDIACSFIDYDIEIPTCVWEACGFYPNWAVPVLLSMSLVKITDGKFQMHDQLRDLGREIVSIKSCNSQSPGPKEGSRIKSYEDTLSALERKQTKQVVTLRLDPSASVDGWINLTTFENVRFLWVDGKVAVGRFWQLPKNITSLVICLVDPNLSVAIRGKVSAMLRNQNNSYLKKLAVLQLDGSSITNNWDGWLLIQKLQGLKVLTLNECKRLTRMPNFSKMVALEYLLFRDCIKVVKINNSIGKLLKLKYLNLEGCVHLQELPEEVGNLEDLEGISLNATNISTLPNSIGKLKNLHILLLKSCGRLDKLPECIGDLGSLVKLDISYCQKLKELPATIGDLTSLVGLDLLGCCQINELPSSITRLVMLKELSLRGCTKIVKLPDDFGNLKSLVKLDLAFTGVAILSSETLRDLKLLKEIDLSGTPVRVLPDTLTQLSHLESLYLTGCRDLQILSELPTCLISLQLMGCCSLKQAPDLSKLNRLEVLSLDDIILSIISTWSPHLRTLFVACTDFTLFLGFPSNLETLTFHGVKRETILPCISNMKKLTVLSFYKCWMYEGIFQGLGVGRLGSLKGLAVMGCDTINKLPDLSQLNFLEGLMVENCEKLVEIPGLGKLISLKELKISNCDSIERLENLKNLTKLQDVEISNCKKFKGIKGFNGPSSSSVIIS